MIVEVLIIEVSREKRGQADNLIGLSSSESMT